MSECEKGEGRNGKEDREWERMTESMWLVFPLLHSAYWAEKIKDTAHNQMLKLWFL